jgi:hypothetical protein
MTDWFECKVSYEAEDGNGKTSKKTESYLVDGVSFTEAEARITEKVAEFIPGEFKVEAVKREKIYEIFRNEGSEVWFKFKIEFVTIDEKSAKEKKTNVIVYLQSSKIEDVVKELNAKMTDSMTDYAIINIAKTKILDVFEYENKL